MRLRGGGTRLAQARSLGAREWQAVAHPVAGLTCELCQAPVVQEVLPKAGLVYSEKGNLSEVLCKPKIMPIKSLTLEKLEQMEKNAAAPTTGVDEEESKGQM